MWVGVWLPLGWGGGGGLLMTCLALISSTTNTKHEDRGSISECIEPEETRIGLECSDERNLLRYVIFSNANR